MVTQNYDVRSKQILLKLGWKRLDERRQNLMEKCMSNIVNDNCPETLKEVMANF